MFDGNSGIDRNKAQKTHCKCWAISCNFGYRVREDFTEVRVQAVGIQVQHLPG